MTEETLKVYGPCLKHRLFHDLERECFYCLVERKEEEWNATTSRNTPFLLSLSLKPFQSTLPLCIRFPRSIGHCGSRTCSDLGLIDPSTHPLTRCVDHLIARLRPKIEPAPHIPNISTQRMETGIG